MSNAKDHIQMTLKSVEGFANGGKLDANELDEIKVFRSIISRIDPSEVDDAMCKNLVKSERK